MKAMTTHEKVSIRSRVDRITISNYKSIRHADVKLDDFNVLVGTNASGKTNFLEALTFIPDAIKSTLVVAYRQRGGRNAVRRPIRRKTTRDVFSIQIFLTLPAGTKARYRVEIGPDIQNPEVPEVVLEELEINQQTIYTVQNGRVHSSQPLLPASSTDRLYLVLASGLSEVREVYDALLSIDYYNFSPFEMRNPKPEDSGFLGFSGSGLATILGRLEKKEGTGKERVLQYLGLIAPQIKDVRPAERSGYRFLEFSIQTDDGKHHKFFPVHSISDGTLRAFALLVSLFMPTTGDGKEPTLVAIEEPESALHPAAVGVIVAALREASHFKQVVVTTHSPDLLQDLNVDEENLLLVQQTDNETRIGKVDEVSKSIIRDALYSVGDLLKSHQLQIEGQKP